VGEILGRRTRLSDAAACVIEPSRKRAKISAGLKPSQTLAQKDFRYIALYNSPTQKPEDPQIDKVRGLG
jgi:hypothetical protein